MDGGLADAEVCCDLADALLVDLAQSEDELVPVVCRGSTCGSGGLPRGACELGDALLLQLLVALDSAALPALDGSFACSSAHGAASE